MTTLPDGRTFAMRAGDHAAYALNDGDGAVRLARRAGTVAVDIETAGLGDRRSTLKAVSLGTSDFAHVLDPAVHRDAIRDALTAARTLIVHNSFFDVPVLVDHGLLRLGDVAKVDDTLVSVRLAAPSEHGGHSLGHACTRHLGDSYDFAKRSLEVRWRAATGKAKKAMFSELGLSSEAYVMYAGFDVIMTARLHAALPAAIERHTVDHPFRTSGDSGYLLEREQTINRMLLARSCTGFTIDFAVVEELKGELIARGAEADAVLERHGIDTSQSRPLVKRAAMLHLEQLGALPAGYPRLLNREPTADKRHLGKIGHPIVDALTVRSEADRFIADYADKAVQLTHNGRIHPRIAVAVAVTGRMSYKDPPIQQLPQYVRRMIVFEVPCTSVDWKSIEPLFFANVAGELGLVEHFEAGGDVYEPVAAAAGVDRSTAKVVLLAQLYGQGPTALGARLGLDEEATIALINLIMKPLPAIRRARNRIRNIGEVYGKVQTMSGRIVPIELDPRTGNTRHLGYLGINYVVQGSCYDLLAEALYEMHRRGLDDALHAAVHDELVVATDAAGEVEAIMQTPPQALVESAGRLPVLRVGRSDLGRHWSAKG